MGESSVDNMPDTGPPPEDREKAPDDAGEITTFTADAEGRVAETVDGAEPGIERIEDNVLLLTNKGGETIRVENVLPEDSSMVEMSRYINLDLYHQSEGLHPGWHEAVNLIKQTAQRHATQLVEAGIRPRVLETGAGTGLATKILAEMMPYADIIAVEIDRKEYEFMLRQKERGELPDNVYPVHGNAEEVKIEGGVDIVCSMFAEHHHHPRDKHTKQALMQRQMLKRKEDLKEKDINSSPVLIMGDEFPSIETPVDAQARKEALGSMHGKFLAMINERIAANSEQEEALNLLRENENASHIDGIQRSEKLRKLMELLQSVTGLSPDEAFSQGISLLEWPDILTAASDQNIQIPDELLGGGEYKIAVCEVQKLLRKLSFSVSRYKITPPEADCPGGVFVLTATPGE